MSFKLENINIEGEEKQEIKGSYDFSKKISLDSDRTFCTCNYDCRPQCGRDGYCATDEGGCDVNYDGHPPRCDEHCSQHAYECEYH